MHWFENFLYNRIQMSNINININLNSIKHFSNVLDSK